MSALAIPPRPRPGRLRRLAALGTAALTAAALAAAAAPAQAQSSGQWQFTGSMATGHSNARLAQLPDGRVLAISGSSAPGVHTATAEIYDPATGRWASAGMLTNDREAFGQPSVLPDGEVLVAGGHDVNVVDEATAELYNPATNQWTPTGSLNTARRYDVQVALTNGQVLVATGSLGPPTCTRYLNSAELYNPATSTWTYTGSTLIPRESDTAIRLADGRVLLAGGYNGSGPGCTDATPALTETYDPATGQWTQAGDLPHGWVGGTMVLLPDHRVLLVDGYQEGTPAFAEAVIFDPATNQWSAAATPNFPRTGAAATLLPDGKVLVSEGGQLQSEIYDPTANTWTLDATALATNNGGQTALLPNGNVLLAGGGTSTGPTTTTELYTTGVVAPPTVTGVIPSTGPLSGGTTVTITGTAFTGATAVRFGSAAASSFQVSGDTSITATAPAVTAVGPVDVTVTTAAGTSATVAADRYTYTTTGLLAPVNHGVTMTVIHGYNEPPSRPDSTKQTLCNVGHPGPDGDHCANQQFGLDLQPGSGWDNKILAPAAGTTGSSLVGPPSAPCLLFTLDDGTNLNICHFASMTAPFNTHVAQGKVLGTAATSWIHLSLDLRSTACSGGWRLTANKTSYPCPVQMVGTHTFEGNPLPWDGTANQYLNRPFTSTNFEQP